MDQRWRFLRPWCTALQGRIVLVCDRVVWETQQRYLRVYIPRHPERAFGKYEKSYIDHFHKVREALLLLAAVAHEAWKYLLSRYCKLNFGNEGEEGFTVEVPIEFGLCFHKYAVVNDKGEFDSDKNAVGTGSLRPTFELGPMIGQMDENPLSVSLGDTVTTFVRDNVTFSRVVVNEYEDPSNIEDETTWQLAFGRLMAGMFDSTRRYPDIKDTRQGILEAACLCLFFEASTNVLVAGVSGPRVSW
ncbi:hypothetical protein JG688_00017716 [Phytophthora aleatoria]|uniref:Uncharacterized protein n=1 Tax=Phytophthora aleatoria TaxID=2496075 RepID=A0A8J5IQE4_9STRA|nr:hypothetical protein JG688_00017716 [Phytophthora aleatoria]